MSHGYESGRLDLPFVGIATFGKSPICADWGALDADVAILCAPFDMGTPWRAGARFGPRAVREASTGHAGACDHEDDATYMQGVRMVDIGDACHEGLERLAGLARRGRVVGVDLVEVAPDYDRTGTTAILAAHLVLNFITG